MMKQVRCYLSCVRDFNEPRKLESRIVKSRNHIQRNLLISVSTIFNSEYSIAAVSDNC